MLFRRAYRQKSDEELMRLITTGQERALDELYARYSARLVRYFFRMMSGDEARAQDLLHDLFVKLIENPVAFDSGRKFSTWVFSVANNMCKNEYRRNAVRASYAQLVTRELPDDDVSGDRKALLDRAVSALDEDDRHLYSLRYEAEASVEEIATMLDCPVGTVKSRLFYLKKKLCSEIRSYQTRKLQYGI